MTIYPACKRHLQRSCVFLSLWCTSLSCWSQLSKWTVSKNEIIVFYNNIAHAGKRDCFSSLPTSFFIWPPHLKFHYCCYPSCGNVFDAKKVQYIFAVQETSLAPWDSGKAYWLYVAINLSIYPVLFFHNKFSWP